MSSACRRQTEVAAKAWSLGRPGDEEAWDQMPQRLILADGNMTYGGEEGPKKTAAPTLQPDNQLTLRKDEAVNGKWGRRAKAAGARRESRGEACQGSDYWRWVDAQKREGRERLR